MAQGARHAQALIAVGVGLALLLLSRRSEATSLPSWSWGDEPRPDDALEDPYTDAGDVFEPWMDWTPSLDPFAQPEDDMQPLKAFLYAIRRSEHAATAVANGVDYRTFYGGELFGNLSDHPVATGEMRGVRLPDEWCRRAGYSPGCVSTAAGAYQITLPTWRAIRVKLPYLEDFSPASQDAAALRLIGQRGALNLIRAGRIEEAVRKLAPVWASLPGSTAGQGGRTMDQVLSYYATGLAMA